ncbi:hypothetical protein BH23ACT5_BH23ACT5_19960 [soil metagenome]
MRPTVANGSSPPAVRIDRRSLSRLAQTTEPAWREAAACREWTEVDFFPFPEDTEAIFNVKQVCSQCSVAEACLSYALATRQGDGIWGGFTPKERTRLRRMLADRARSTSEPAFESAAAGGGSRQ